MLEDCQFSSLMLTFFFFFFSSPETTLSSIRKSIAEARNTLRSFGKAGLRRKATGSFLVTYPPPAATLEEKCHLILLGEKSGKHSHYLRS